MRTLPQRSAVSTNGHQETFYKSTLNILHVIKSRLAYKNKVQQINIALHLIHHCPQQHCHEARLPKGKSANSNSRHREKDMPKY